MRAAVIVAVTIGMSLVCRQAPLAQGRLTFEVTSVEPVQRKVPSSGAVRGAEVRGRQTLAQPINFAWKGQ